MSADMVVNYIKQMSEELAKIADRAELDEAAALLRIVRGLMQDASGEFG